MESFEPETQWSIQFQFWQEIKMSKIIIFWTSLWASEKVLFFLSFFFFKDIVCLDFLLQQAKNSPEFHWEVPARNKHIRSEIREKYFLHGRPNKGSWNYIKIKGMAFPAASSTTFCRPNGTNHRGQHTDTYNCCQDKDKGNLQDELSQIKHYLLPPPLFFFKVKFLKWTEMSDSGFLSICDLGGQIQVNYTLRFYMQHK